MYDFLVHDCSKKNCQMTLVEIAVWKQTSCFSPILGGKLSLILTLFLKNISSLRS